MHNIPCWVGRLAGLALPLVLPLALPLPPALPCAYILRSCGSNKDIGSSLNFFLIALVVVVVVDDDDDDADDAGVKADGPLPVALPVPA